MSEINQLIAHINKSGHEGVKTAAVRGYYERTGSAMIKRLIASGKYVTRKVAQRDYTEWRIYKAGNEPN